MVSGANFFFTTQLMEWNFKCNRRKMPWKGEKNPYRIWLSEIILQQTRVEQGLNYYNRFICTFPDVQQLAAAPEEEVFKLWEGLGYYSRCRNMIATAKEITTVHNGVFPDTYESIIQLKGIGPYTAAAIASFAFNLPHAVVDGNVYRVLARYFGISLLVDSNEGKLYFSRLANELLDKSVPGIFNQAIMDLGATICKPLPLCMECPVNEKCVAFNTNSVRLLPIKGKKTIKKTRWFYYIIAEYNGSFLIKKREGKDIWQNLHEFILLESESELFKEEVFQSKIFQQVAAGAEIIQISGVGHQHLTHQTIKGQFFHIQLSKPLFLPGYRLEQGTEIAKLAFPKYINRHFENGNYFKLNASISH